MFLEGIGRFALRFTPGQYWLTNGQWLRHDETGAVPVDDPLGETWRAAAAVRNRLIRELDIGAYVIPVAMFPDMAPDANILAAAQGRSVPALCGQGNDVQRLINLPEEEEARPQLSKWFIEREVATLSRPASRAAPDPAEPVAEELAEESPQGPSGQTGALVIQRVETVNIYVTAVNGGAGAEPPLLTVQGR